jgi:hypothetical protein
VLKHAYLNFSLVLNDRSFGIHNPAYMERLLDDSIAAIDHFKDVSLAAFTAEAGLFRVTVKWTTARENTIQGFNVYRAAGMNGRYKKINEELIPATGTAGEGDDYEYTDRGAVTGVKYYYKIEDIAADATATLHNAVAARPGLLALLKSMKPAAEAAAASQPEKTCQFQ